MNGSADGPLTTWWRGEDSNLRRHRQQIYSLSPLAAREPLRRKIPFFLIEQVPPEKEKEWEINELHKWNQGLQDT